MDMAWVRAQAGLLLKEGGVLGWVGGWVGGWSPPPPPRYAIRMRVHDRCRQARS